MESDKLYGKLKSSVYPFWQHKISPAPPFLPSFLSPALKGLTVHLSFQFKIWVTCLTTQKFVRRSHKSTRKWAEITNLHHQLLNAIQFFRINTFHSKMIKYLLF